MTALLLLAAALASYVGFACLALAMAEHWMQAGGSADTADAARRPSRVGGWCLIALAYGLCLVRDGASFGTLLWVVLLIAGALGVALTLTWRARWFGFVVRGKTKGRGRGQDG